ncbi:MAG: hypothetical protein KAQ68_07850 [Clostridiales bacterium]|nr:hypothetical protein [Clostridiales bacterium]
MKYELYKQFGLCYNHGDFSSLIAKLHTDCIYQSFDFLYVLNGNKKVIEELEKQSRYKQTVNDNEKLDIYTGYYPKQIFLLKTIKECCIIVKRGDKKSIRIITFTKKWGKVTHIIGLDPSTTKHVKCVRV